jgi:hypothetical protein
MTKFLLNNSYEREEKTIPTDQKKYKRMARLLDIPSTCEDDRNLEAFKHSGPS